MTNKKRPKKRTGKFIILSKTRDVYYCQWYKSRPTFKRDKTLAKTFYTKTAAKLFMKLKLEKYYNKKNRKNKLIIIKK